MWNWNEINDDLIINIIIVLYENHIKIYIKDRNKIIYY